MKELHVDKNKIFDSSGKEIILKGININSPGILKYEENHNFLQDIKEIKKLGANSVRIPICPAYWKLKENYISDILDPIVKLTKELNLYCLLDWHAQGNLERGITRDNGKDLIEGEKKYDANQSLAFSALEEISTRYGKENHILFDLFSMPIDIENTNWKNISQKFVDKVRKNTKNILVINGTNWGSDLSWVFDNQVHSENIIYGISYYSMVKSKDLDNLLKVKKKHPVIFSECGFTTEGYFKGNEEYIKNLKNSIIKDRIGFFAWCYHPTRFPTILNSWNPSDLTDWGIFLKDNLI